MSRSYFKKIRFSTFVGILCFWLFLSAFSVPKKPENKIFVNDFANVLSSQTEDELYSGSEELSSKTGVQFVVVTIESLYGVPIDEYSLELARSWGIGDKNEDNGLLILLSINDREIKVEVGTGLEGIINDSKAGRFIDEYAIPHFKRNQWDEGIKSLYSGILEEICKEYGVTINSENIPLNSGHNGGFSYDKGIITWVIVVFLLIVLLALVSPFHRFGLCCSILDSFSSSSGDGCGGGGFGGSSFGGGGFSGGGASRKF